MFATAEKSTKPRASKRITMTPQEQAEARAARIVELRDKINTLEGELATETDELVKYVESTGQEEFQTLKAIKRFGSARLVGEDMTPKQIAYAEEQLINELPDFVKKSLDTSKMFNALKTNPVVANALEVKGLKFEQKTSWTLKEKVGK